MALTIAIVGAGIGGLTAALALSARGHLVTLIERRTGFSEVGAGLQLSPNASRVLIDLGLGPALRRAATEPERIVVRRLADGRRVGEVALGAFMQQRFGAPYYVIHRAALQTILLDAVRGRSDIRLLVGRKATAVESGPERATVTVESAGGAVETVSADVAIGADGLWSRVRPAALADGRGPVYRGAAAWRATIAAEAAPAELRGNETGLWLGSGGHVVHYPLQAGRHLNLVVVQRRSAPVAGWSTPGQRHELLTAVGQADPLVAELIRIPNEWLLWSLFDLPAKAMARGRVALIGDAAHPVLPFIAQGGALAIEDAAVLAAMLSRPGHAPEAALQAYAAERLRRVRRVQDEARRNSAVYHAGAVMAFGRDLVMRRLGPDGMAERYAWIYGWTPPG